MFGRGNVDNAQDFMVFGQMGLNSSAVALAPTPSAAFTTVFPVFQGIQMPIGLKFVITDSPGTKQSWMSSLITSFPVKAYTS